MTPELSYLTAVVQSLKARLAALRENPEAGYSTETVIVTALLAAAAIIVVGVIVAKVTAAANNIQTR